MKARSSDVLLEGKKMAFKNIYYAEVIIEVPVTIQVAANDEQEAFARLMDGAWHNIDAKQYNGAKVKKLGTITKGPSINGLGRKE